MCSVVTLDITVKPFVIVFVVSLLSLAASAFLGIRIEKWLEDSRWKWVAVFPFMITGVAATFMTAFSGVLLLLIGINWIFTLAGE